MIIFIKTQRKGTAANSFFEEIIKKCDKSHQTLEEYNKNLGPFFKLIRKIHTIKSDNDNEYIIFNDFGFVKNLILLFIVKVPLEKIKIYTTFYHHIFNIRECFIFFQLNEFWKLISLKFYPFFKRNIITKNIKFITVSEFTKNNMIDNFSIDKNKILVLWNQIIAKDIINTISAKNNLQEEEPYILIISTLLKRKNVSLIEKISNIFGKKIKFVCPLPKKIYSKRKLNIIKKNKVQIFHDLSYKQMKSLYLNSSCILIPSKYEGLSLVPLEGIHFSKPIVMSKISPHLYWKLPNRFYFDLYNYKDLLIKLNFYLSQEKLFIDYSTFKKFNYIFYSAQKERNNNLSRIYN